MNYCWHYRDLVPILISQKYSCTNLSACQYVLDDPSKYQKKSSLFIHHYSVLLLQGKKQQWYTNSLYNSHRPVNKFHSYMSLFLTTYQVLFNWLSPLYHTSTTFFNWSNFIYTKKTQALSLLKSCAQYISPNHVCGGPMYTFPNACIP